MTPRTIGIMAVLTGLMADIALTRALSIIATVSALVHLACQGMGAPEAQRFIGGSLVFDAGLTVLGLSASVFGGILTGLMSRTSEMRWALAMGLLSLGYSLAMMAAAPPDPSSPGPNLWLTIIGSVLVVPAAMFGGFLGGGIRKIIG